MSSKPADHLLHAITAAADSAGHTLDEHQRAAADALADFGADLQQRRRESPFSGVYLWGTVGRGKTWLADALFAALPTTAKRRLHFHSFYRGLHTDLYRNGTPAPGAIDTAIEELVGGLDLLFFDEFHLHDAGDATLALRVLQTMRERRIPILATSNYPPSGLLPDPMFHHLFAPGVALIEQHLRVVTLDGSHDYRRVQRDEDGREGFARSTWQHPDATDATSAPSARDAVTLTSGGHTFHARRADAAHLWFTFEELCERPASASDYIAWAERWDRWTIEGIPRLTECSPQARQRFLNLVDILSDRGTEATFISPLSPEQVLERGEVPTARGAAADREELGLGIDGLPIDVVRTASRLAMVRRLS